MTESSRFFDPKLTAIMCGVVTLATAMTIFGTASSLDSRFYYTGNEARALFAGLNNTEVHRYIVIECLDLLLITAYTVMLWIALGRIHLRRVWRTIFTLAPAFFDLIETLTVLYTLLISGTYQGFEHLGVITLCKWLAGLVAGLLVLWGRSNGAARASKILS